MTRTEVRIGETWSRSDPSGASVTFEVTALSEGPSGARVATGRTARGKLIKCQIRQMLTSPRFRFVSEAPASNASMSVPIPPRAERPGLAAGSAVRDEPRRTVPASPAPPPTEAEDDDCLEQEARDRQAARYRERRAKGQCTQCPGEALPSAAMCGGCLQALRDRRLEWRRQGRCLNCGRVAESGMTRCDRCARVNARACLRRSARKAALPAPRWPLPVPSLPTQLVAFQREGALALLDAVCASHRVDREELLGPSRVAPTVRARRELARGLRARGLSYERIGELLDRDHKTVRALLTRNGWTEKKKVTPASEVAA